MLGWISLEVLTSSISEYACTCITEQQLPYVYASHSEHTMFIFDGHTTGNAYIL